MEKENKKNLQQGLILWVTTLVITLVIGLMISLYSSDYPITGSFVFEDTSISYRFEQNHYGNTGFPVEVLTSSEDVKGYVEWQIVEQSRVRHREVFTYQDGMLKATIPPQPTETEVSYKVNLLFGYERLEIPDASGLRVTFYDAIPFMGWMLYYLSFIIFLILSIRAGLEGFIKKGHVRMYTILAAIAALLYGLFVMPMVESFKLGGIGCIKVLAPSQIFPAEGIAVVAIWIGTLIGVLLIKKRGWLVVSGSILGLLSMFLF